MKRLVLCRLLGRHHWSWYRAAQTGVMTGPVCTRCNTTKRKAKL